MIDSDLISRQDAIKALSHNKCGNDENDVAVQHDIETIRALDAVKQVEWVPCSERMPSDDGDYLVTYESKYAEDYGFDSIGIAPFDTDCEGFGVWRLGGSGYDFVRIPVTAWMPLPEPYKEENNATD